MRPLAVAVVIWFVGLLRFHPTSVYSYRPGLFGLFCGFPAVSTTLRFTESFMRFLPQVSLLIHVLPWLFVRTLPHGAHTTS